MIDEQKLRELAGAATPGHWTMQHIGRNEWGAEVWTMNNEEIGHSEIAETYTSENAEFITAANPAAILALLDELQSLRSERTAWRVSAENAEAAVKQARIDALEEAKQAVADVDEPGWTGYECPNTFQDGVHACAVAIESLKGTP